MSRYGLREIKIDFRPYEYVATCIVGPWAGVERYARRHFRDPNRAVHHREPEGYTMFDVGTDYGTLVWLPRKPRTPRDYGIVTHECLHLVRHLFDWVDMQLNEHSEEAYCHALEYAVATILKGCK